MENKNIGFRNIKLIFTKKALLDSIIDNCDYYRSKILEKMSPSERAWRSTRKNLKPKEKSNQIKKRSYNRIFKDI